MKLFSSSSKASRAREERPAASKASKEDSVGVSDSIYSDEESASSEEEEEYEGNESAKNKGTPKGEDSLSFESLGLSEWVCKSVSAMGFRQPTPVQQKCVPAILSGHDVIGCAETGSGKTAAFALPILNHLSKDPYGIFAVILTPTRELGAQISEQFVAFGAPIGLRVALIIGGVNMTEQSLNLKRLPHIVIATPGRLRAHLEGPDPPNLSRTPYLVLDEADRLLSQGFSSELRVILTAMSSKKRKTFLFSATMTDSLTEVEKLAMSQTLRFDLTAERRVPSQLVQEYLFMPSQVKMNYLVAVLDKAVKRVGGGGDGKDDADNDVGLGSHDYKKGGKKGGSAREKHNRRKSSRDAALEGLLGRDGDDDGEGTRYSSSSVIIFAGSCRKCQETHETLKELGYDSVVLHSMMPQPLRTQSLSSFKNQRSRILIATDVASRGLDIPEVDLVVNFDLPRVAEDYIHRVGRTARAGKAGRALALVTQYDVDMVHGIEDYMGLRLQASTQVSEDDVVALLNVVSKATRLAQMKLLESGFDERYQDRRAKRRSNKGETIAGASGGQAKSAGKRRAADYPDTESGGADVDKKKQRRRAGRSLSEKGLVGKQGSSQSKKMVKVGKGIPRKDEMAAVMDM